jgi:hypothetical protein
VGAREQLDEAQAGEALAVRGGGQGGVVGLLALSPGGGVAEDVALAAPGGDVELGRVSASRTWQPVQAKAQGMRVEQRRTVEVGVQLDVVLKPRRQQERQAVRHPRLVQERPHTISRALKPCATSSSSATSRVA